MAATPQDGQQTIQRNACATAQNFKKQVHKLISPFPAMRRLLCRLRLMMGEAKQVIGRHTEELGHGDYLGTWHISLSIHP